MHELCFHLGHSCILQYIELSALFVCGQHIPS